MAFYGVQKGRNGAAVYTSWKECELMTKGFPGAKFKRFETERDAENFAFKTEGHLPDETYDALIYTDGSFLSDKRGGYAAVFIVNGNPYGVICGPSDMPAVIRNIGGEIQAAEEAVTKAIELGYKAIKILHDYEGVGAWAKEEWERTKPSTIQYHAFIQEKQKEIHIDFEKVEGHSGNHFNDVADNYAKKGAMSGQKIVLGFGQQFSIDGAGTNKKKPKVYICPECGAVVQKMDAYCKTCGIIFSEKTLPVLKEVNSQNKEAESPQGKQVCYNCGLSILEGRAKFSVEIYRFGKKQRVDCCCEKCAKETIDKEVERLAIAYEEVASQSILVR